MIRPFLTRHKLIGRMTAKELLLRAKTRRERLVWCRKRLQFWSQLWTHFVFTDEFRFTLRQRRSLWVRRSQNERYSPLITFSYSNDRRSFHFWSTIPYDQRVRLIKAPKKRSLLDYIYNLEEAATLFFPEWGYKLVDDNSLIHRSHTIKESVSWPTRSPDLNPHSKGLGFYENSDTEYETWVSAGVD